MGAACRTCVDACGVGYCVVGGLRWVNVTIPSTPVLAVAWLLSLGLATWVWRERLRDRMVPSVLMARLPATAFFAVLLVTTIKGADPLALYALAFVPPYVLVTPWQRLGI